MSAGRGSGKIAGVSLFGFKIGTPPSPTSGSTKDKRTIEQLSVVVQQRPGDWTAENDLADALLAAGRIDEAVARLCDTGERLAAEGFLAKAHALFKKVVRLQPQNEYAIRRVAELTTERIQQSGVRTAPRGGDMAAASDQAANPPDATDARQASAFEAPEPAPAVAAAEEQSWTAAANGLDADMSTGVGELSAVDEDAEPAFAASTDAGAAVQDRDIEFGSGEPMAHDARWSEPSWSEQPHDQLSDNGSQEAADAESVSQAPEESRDTINTTVEFLKESARTYPDQIEPVAKLAEFAASVGLEDVLAEAQARLCDLHARAGNFAAARTIAEALLARDPDNTRHRARLDYIMGELSETGELAAAPATIDYVEEIELIDEIEEGVSPETKLREALTIDVRAAAADACALAEARLTLEAAVADPLHQFAAARQLARMEMETGNLGAALGWLESAAAGTLSAADEEELAYDIGVVLERAGEFDRALGVFQEIVAKVGANYRDVSERIRQLSTIGDPAASASEEFLAV